MSSIDGSSKVRSFKTHVKGNVLKVTSTEMNLAINQLIHQTAYQELHFRHLPFSRLGLGGYSHPLKFSFYLKRKPSWLLLYTPFEL